MANHVGADQNPHLFELLITTLPHITVMAAVLPMHYSQFVASHICALGTRLFNLFIRPVFCSRAVCVRHQELLDCRLMIEEGAAVPWVTDFL